MTSPVRFDWTFNFGHVLTVAAVLGGTAFGYVNLRRDVQDHDRRIATAETLIAQAHARLAQQDVIEAGTRAQIDGIDRLMGEVRDELKTMNRRNP